MEPGKNVFTVHVSALGSAVTVIASLMCNDNNLGL